MIFAFYVLTHLEFHKNQKNNVSSKHEHEVLKKDKLANLLTPDPRLDNFEQPPPNPLHEQQQQLQDPGFLEKVRRFLKN